MSALQHLNKDILWCCYTLSVDIAISLTSAATLLCSPCCESLQDPRGSIFLSLLPRAWLTKPSTIKEGIWSEIHPSYLPGSGHNLTAAKRRDYTEEINAGWEQFICHLGQITPQIIAVQPPFLSLTDLLL